MGNHGLFLFIFFLNISFTEKCRLKRDPILECQSQSQACWPQDNHQGPRLDQFFLCVLVGLAQWWYPPDRKERKKCIFLCLIQHHSSFLGIENFRMIAFQFPEFVTSSSSFAFNKNEKVPEKQKIFFIYVSISLNIV